MAGKKKEEKKSKKQEQKKQEKGGFFSLFKKKTNKESQTPSAPAKNTDRPAGSSVEGPPPSYDNLIKQYKSISDKAAEMAVSPSKHAKMKEYQELQRKKGEADEEYNRGGGDLKKKTDAENAKISAETGLKIAGEKVSKSVAEREKLEEHKGSKIVDVVLHANELSKRDDKLEDPDASPREKARITAENNMAQRQEQEKEDEEEGTGFITAVTQWIGNILSSVSDGKKAAEAIGGKFERPSMSNQVSGSDGAQNIAGTAIAFVNTIISAMQLMKAIGDASKKNRDNLMDRQEQWRTLREILGKISDTVSNAIGAISIFTESIPIVGEVLNIASAGFQMVVTGMNLSSDRGHYKEMKEQKASLWAEIERKRSKYKGEESDYYKIDTSGMSFFSSKDERVKDQRVRLQEIVGKAMQVEKQEVPAEQAGKTKSNKTVYANAEKNISTMISSYRDRRHNGDLSDQEKKDYKKNMHAMEALEMMSQYRTVEKAEKKMGNAIVI